jgi:D-aminoacyl-tRNA deacylase
VARLPAAEGGVFVEARGAMRAVLQRVNRASVVVDGSAVGRIGPGWLVLLGVARGDDDDDALRLAEKVVNLRAFADEQGKMNRNVAEAGGAVLVVSQFTLMADCRGGRRPSFTEAAEPSEAERLYLRFVEAVRASGLETATGTFRAMMQVELVNDGPVTFLLDTRRAF